MNDRTAAETAAIEHIFTTLNQQIAGANRVAESQEAAAEKEPKYSRREGHRESAEFHRALAVRLGDVVRVAAAEFDFDPHHCDNCSGIDPETCLYNGEKEA